MSLGLAERFRLGTGGCATHGSAAWLVGWRGRAAATGFWQPLDASAGRKRFEEKKHHSLPTCEAYIPCLRGSGGIVGAEKESDPLYLLLRNIPAPEGVPNSAIYLAIGGAT